MCFTQHVMPVSLQAHRCPHTSSDTPLCHGLLDILNVPCLMYQRDAMSTLLVKHLRPGYTPLLIILDGELEICYVHPVYMDVKSDTVQCLDISTSSAALWPRMITSTSFICCLIGINVAVYTLLSPETHTMAKKMLSTHHSLFKLNLCPSGRHTPPAATYRRPTTVGNPPGVVHGTRYMSQTESSVLMTTKISDKASLSWFCHLQINLSSMSRFLD